MASKHTEKDEPIEQQLPPVVDGEMASILTIELKEKKTKKPAYYTEGALIADMKGAEKYVDGAELKKDMREAKGLGTAATRDSIIEELKYKKLLETRGKYIVSTKKGRDLIAYLPASLYDIATTARWESELGVVAERGGGRAWEKAIEAEVQKQVSILKAHGPMTRSEAVETRKPTTSTGAKRPMSDTGAQNMAPSEKQVAFAKTIAKRLNKTLPDDIETNLSVCRQFIDDNIEQANATPSPPSEKQLNFARNIAQRKGVELPPEIAADFRAISTWIDENK
ncbi:hypothetical protein F6X40_10495 [Paraburkholderia sp. UCT31]|uniref:DNA topoisomerase n=1 Tax=Paraburkholderia sp. UCT31 TaxID=2615209 RepID=UPI001655BFA9|nr:DNA topoisomerase [Paraburkholderia sp. UCT31]MBC8737236.1 hypothetical protein [Paraburkholderia sp. UCT31]